MAERAPRAPWRDLLTVSERADVEGLEKNIAALRGRLRPLLRAIDGHRDRCHQRRAHRERMAQARAAVAASADPEVRA